VQIEQVLAGAQAFLPACSRSFTTRYHRE